MKPILILMLLRRGVGSLITGQPYLLCCRLLLRAWEKSLFLYDINMLLDCKELWVTSVPREPTSSLHMYGAVHSSDVGNCSPSFVSND